MYPRANKCNEDKNNILFSLQSLGFNEVPKFTYKEKAQILKEYGPFSQDRKNGYKSLKRALIKICDNKSLHSKQKIALIEGLFNLVPAIAADFYYDVKSYRKFISWFLLKSEKAKTIKLSQPQINMLLQYRPRNTQ